MLLSVRRNVVIRSLFLAAAAAIVCSCASRSRPEQAAVQGPEIVSAPDPSTAPLFWNVWEEEGEVGPSFDPAPFLVPGTTYTVIVDLSGAQYREHEGVSTQPARPEFRLWLDDLLRRTRASTVTLQAVITPSSDAFEPTRDYVQDLTVSLDKVRRLKALDSRPVTFAELPALPPDPDFLIGRTQFRLRTRQGWQGMTALAISLWADRPIAEVVVPVCVASEQAHETVCRPAPVVSPGLNGVDSARIAAEGGASPDASLHYLQLGHAGPVVGLFHQNCEACPYVRFDVPFGSLSDLAAHLARTNVEAFAAALSEPDRLRIGQGLYNVLIPPDPPEETPGTGTTPSVRNAFEAFLRPRLVATPAASTDAPSIFVRMLGVGDADPLLLPFGLVAVRLDDAPARFLAEYFRIEMPLAAQSYQSTPQCIATWHLALPSSVGEADFEPAWTRAGRWLGPLSASAGALRYGTIGELAAWLGQSSYAAEGSALVVLAHHADDRLFFAPNQQMTSDEILIGFRRPSLAILNGCGTGAASGSGFVGALNKRGVPAIIATTTTVTAAMAGEFLGCLAERLQRGGGAPEPSTLSSIFFDSVRCVRARYGSRGFTYVLLGNGNLRVCNPFKEL